MALGNGTYAYARVLRDASIAVYRSTGRTREEPPIGQREFLFTVGIYEDIPRKHTRSNRGSRSLRLRGR